jgi:hypothetical protein
MLPTEKSLWLFTRELARSEADVPTGLLKAHGEATDSRASVG